MPQSTQNDPEMTGLLRRREWMLAALATLAGCGGGVDSGGTGTGDQSTLAIGAIDGFGSIIVNGVRFDESQALIDDDDGSTRLRSELRLGMRVELSASAVTVLGGVAGAVASTVRIRSELGGPIESIDLVAGRLVVLGQRVDIAATTVVEGGLAALTVGTVVWVCATLDLAAGRYVATRIEPRQAAAVYKIRGVVGALDLVHSTLDIGALRIDWSAVAPQDPATALAPGRFVRVRLATLPVSGIWQAVALEADAPPVQEDRAFTEIEGRITAFASPTSFAVEGIAVDAGAAAFPDGTAGLALGSKVEVEGRLQGGILRADRVSLEDDDGDDESFELNGVIDAADASARWFVVRGTTVHWTAATRFDSSTAADLVVGRRVAVRGRLGAGGEDIEATLIHVEA